MNDTWIQSVRGKKEAVAVILTAVVILVVSLTVSELYPFSAPSMFSVKVDSACEYWIQAPDGEWLSTDSFGLQLNNPHDPPVQTFGRDGYGRRSPHSINFYSKIATKDEVIRQVRESIAEYPEYEFVDCTQRIVKSRDDGSVGVVQEHNWRVFNPKFKSDAENQTE